MQRRRLAESNVLLVIKRGIIITFLCGLYVFAAGGVGYSADSETVSVSDTGITVIKLRESDLLSIVAAESEPIREQKLETLIAEQGVQNAKSIFEPRLEAGYDLTYNFEQNDTELAVQRDNEDDYEKRENVMSTAVVGLLPTGAEYRLFYDLNDPENSLQDEDSYGKEYRVRTGVEISQPLLKDFGFKANRANIDKAETEFAIARENFRRSQMTSTYLAAVAYAELQLSQARVHLQTGILGLEREAADLVEKMILEGKASSSQLFYAESNIARREARLSYASKLLRRNSSVVRQMLIGTSSETLGMVEAADQIGSVTEPGGVPDEASEPQEFMSKRPEYHEARMQRDLSQIRYDYANNQNRPDLDLKVTYGKTGLGEDWSSANNLLDENYEFWSVGAFFEMPILGDRKGESTVQAAKLQMQKDSLKLSNLEMLIQDEILTARAEKEKAEREVTEMMKVIGKLEDLLAEDHKKQQHGRLNRYEVLDREIELEEARIGLAEKQTEFRKMLLTVWLSEGRILDALGIAEQAVEEVVVSSVES